MGKLREQVAKLKRSNKGCYVYFLHDFDMRKYNESWSLAKKDNKYYFYINNQIYNNYNLSPTDEIEEIISKIDNDKNMALLNIRHSNYITMICEQILQGNEMYYDFNIEK
jgi:hypothetical protein